MHHPRHYLRGVGLSLLTILVASSCTDEQIVFRDRELFEEPPAAALDFLGYTDVETKLTVCGNCHVSQQADWKETGHANAWADLQDSGHAQASCEGCHTVNQLGNFVEQPGGYIAFADERYHDVQCESCHGPGLDHVQAPDASGNQPLAPISVGTDMTTGCGECHSGSHNPFVEEWAQSPHGTALAYPAGREGCNSCHEGKAALQAFGVNADYLEKGSNDILPLTCAVCHDPHEARNEGQLRFSVATTDIEINLCAQCHNRRSNPDPTSSHGLEPHAPSGALLLGEAGWFPPGASIDQGQIRATHGSEGNDRLCATCHLATTTITDPLSGEFVLNATGHTFNAIPCRDPETGVPTSEDCELTLEDRSFVGCTASGCHGSEDAAFSILTVVTGRLESLHDELHDLLVQVDPNLTGAGGEIDGNAPEFTVAEGAYFNMELAVFGGQGRPSERLAFASAAVHNPFLMEELLRASIELVEDTYGVTASPGIASVRHEPKLSDMSLRSTQD